jgi:esterase/lipase superfamily enzyme
MKNDINAMGYRSMGLRGIPLLLLLYGCQTQLMPTPNLYLSDAVCKNIFNEVPSDFQSNTADILYVTDRKPSVSKQGKLEYGSGRSPSIAFGSCLVEIGKGISWQTLVENSCKRHRSIPLPLSIKQIIETARSVEIPIPLIRTPDGLVVEDPQAKAQQEEMVRKFHGEIGRRLDLTGRKEAFIFIHGYHSAFEDPMFVMAGLWHFLGRQGIPIVYTWPSGGKSPLQGYTYDRESGEFTICHLKNFLQTLASCPGLEKIHVISHSRGTDIATSALGELVSEIRAAQQSPHRELKLGNFILAAPDLDMEVAIQRFATKRLAWETDRTTMYVSEKDRAIGLSDWLFSSQHRLGQLRIQDVPDYLKKSMRYIDQFQTIDAQVRTDSTGHSYFHASPAVSSDLILLLRDNREPGQKNGRPLIPVIDNYWKINDDYLENGLLTP